MAETERMGTDLPPEDEAGAASEASLATIREQPGYALQGPTGKRRWHKTQQEPQGVAGYGQPMQPTASMQKATPEQLQEYDEFVSSVSGSLMERAKEHEPEVTEALQGAAEAHGAEMAGLDFRLKQEKSMRSKIVDKVKEAARQVTQQEAAEMISDALRYTMVASPERYTQSVRAALLALRQKGHTPKKIKNYWHSGGPYRGINVAMETADGFNWELQFHTKQSLETKEEAHVLYERARYEESPDVRADIEGLMIQKWEGVAIPMMVREELSEYGDTFVSLAERDWKYYALTTTGSPEDAYGLFRWRPGTFERLNRSGQWEEDYRLARYVLLGESGAIEVDKEKARSLFGILRSGWKDESFRGREEQ